MAYIDVRVRICAQHGYSIQSISLKPHSRVMSDLRSRELAPTIEILLQPVRVLVVSMPCNVETNFEL